MNVMLPRCLLLSLSFYAGQALADNSVNIDQVPPEAHLKKSAVKNPILPSGIKDTALQPDHQEEVLNDPLISDFGRTQAVINGNAPNHNTGTNSVVVNQDALAATGTGSATGNNVVIHQNGTNNTSKVHQQGQDNDLYLQQTGDHNTSDEQQIGSHNHKVKIQNGIKQETSQDPYDNKD